MLDISGAASLPRAPAATHKPADLSEQVPEEHAAGQAEPPNDGAPFLTRKEVSPFSSSESVVQTVPLTLEQTKAQWFMDGAIGVIAGSTEEAHAGSTEETNGSAEATHAGSTKETNAGSTEATEVITLYDSDETEEDLAQDSSPALSQPLQSTLPNSPAPPPGLPQPLQPPPTPAQPQPLQPPFQSDGNYPPESQTDLTEATQVPVDREMSTSRPETELCEATQVPAMAATAPRLPQLVVQGGARVVKTVEQSSADSVSTVGAQLGNITVEEPPAKRIRSPAGVGAEPRWVRKFSELNFGRVLGSGSTGQVFAVDCSGLPMAAKRIPFLVQSERKVAERKLRKEFRALNRLNHENVLQVMGIVVDQSDAVYLLTELMHQSLRHLLDQEPARITESPGTQVKVLKGVVNGMDHLHKENMLHHDLKSENLLLTRSLDVKIADFGMATGTGGSALTKTRHSGAGTQFYEAPELFDEGPVSPDGTAGEPEFTRECDVYAFGLICWELLTGERPWAGKSEISLCRALEKEQRPSLTDEQKEDYVGSIVCRCWAQDPASRPTFQQLQSEIRVYQAHTKPIEASAATLVAQARDLLIWPCSPLVSPLTQVGQEATEVALAWGNGGEPGLKICWGGSAADLSKELDNPGARRFLFSGHADAPSGGGGQRTLGFTGPGGVLEKIDPPQLLADLLGSYAPGSGGSLDLVFLNGCCSLDLGKAVHAAGVQTVICWQTKAQDEPAKILAVEFFRHVVLGKAYPDAFGQAVQEVKLVVREQTSSAGNVTRVRKFEMRVPGTPPGAAFGANLIKPSAAGIPVLLHTPEVGDPITVYGTE